MKTVEELRDMTHEGLVEYAQQMQKKLEEQQSLNEYFKKEKDKFERKFSGLRDMVKSLVVLVD